MGGEELPTLAESTAGIRDTLKALRLDLISPPGVGLSRVPEAVDTWFAATSGTLNSLTVMLTQGIRAVLESRAETRTTLDEIRATLITAIQSQLGVPLNKINTALVEEIAAKLQAAADKLKEISDAAKLVPPRI